MTDAVSATLVTRRATHGEFTDHARVTQALKSVCQTAPSWPSMTPIQREALDMILHKIGRVCCGDPSHADHYHDIAGYARLVEERLA